MTRLIGITLTLAALTIGTAFTATNPWLQEVSSSRLTPFGAGGPDAYGYVWIDNDTTAPGTPTYNWVDITTVGDSIEGLGDDNIVGPFSVGFDFPYYWYQVNQFYVGSNGYLRFSFSGQWAQPFPGIPDPAEPNDVLAVLVADLLFGGASTGRAYYYSNGVDSLVVSFIQVPGWSTGGSHTFQVVLNRADSTITYQYGPQQGTFSNDETLIGIENATGTVGLQYLADLQPSQNLPHDSLALVFTPPDSTSYQAHDVGVVYVQNKYSGGFFVHPGGPTTLWCKVKNVGNQPEGSFDVTCEVRNPSNQVVYRDTVTVAPMNPGDEDSVVFSPDWVPSSTGQYRVTATTRLTGDMNPNNNSVLVECRVVLYPGALLFDDGGNEFEWSWEWTPGQEAGMGTRFVPPSYPCRIDSISYYITYLSAIPLVWRVYDDDGPDGYPGTILAEDSIIPSGVPAWITADVDLVISDGSFYLAWIQIGADPPRLGIDETPPISRQALEYTGTWAEFRDKNTRDLMIRAWVNYGMGVDDLTDARCQAPGARLLQNYPNPFTTSTTIRYQAPADGGTRTAASLAIYDLGGRLVRTLVHAEPIANDQRQMAISWDGRDGAGQEVPSGLYFYRLNLGSSSLVKKMVVLR